MAAAAKRMIRGLGKRAADVDALPYLVELHAAVEAELAAAARACVEREHEPWSWGDVGRALGITRQGARQRFGQVTRTTGLDGPGTSAAGAS